MTHRNQSRAVPEYDFLFKVVLIGAPRVGKTSVFVRFTDGAFREDAASHAIDFKTRSVQLNDKILKLQLWDTDRPEAGAEKSDLHFMRGAHGAVLVVDATMPFAEQLDDLNVRLESMKGIRNCQSIMMRTKSDVASNEAEVSAAKEYAATNQLKLFEVSAKSGNGIEAAFQTLVDAMWTSHAAAADVKRTRSSGVRSAFACTDRK